jgi:hypothetical protein
MVPIVLIRDVLGYTCVFNVLDYSVSVIPVTRAKKDIDVYLSGYSPLNKMDTLVHDDCTLLLQFLLLVDIPLTI